MVDPRVPPPVRRHHLSSARTSRRIATIAPAPGQFTGVAAGPARVADALAQAPALPALPKAPAEPPLTDRKVGIFGRRGSVLN